MPLPLNRMPEGVDEYSDTKNAPEHVEKKKCRMVRELNAAFPLDHVGKQYDGNPEATKREQSESLHIATRQVGERPKCGTGYWLRHRVKCSIKEGHVNPLAVAGCHHCLVRSLFHFETLSELIEINPESR